MKQDWKITLNNISAANSGLAIGGVSYSTDTFVVGSTVILRINFCGKMHAHRPSPSRKPLKDKTPLKSNRVGFLFDCIFYFSNRFITFFKTNVTTKLTIAPYLKIIQINKLNYLYNFLLLKAHLKNGS